MNRFIWLAMCWIGVSVLAAEAPAPLYSEDFESRPEGAAPAEIILLSGRFTVQKLDSGKALAVAPEPLDGFFAIFGPEKLNQYTVTARIRASRTGRRFPEFGIGGCGAGQFKLWVMPATGKLQIIRAEDVKAEVAYPWENDGWTMLKLRLSARQGGRFAIEGKAWPQGKAEPDQWMIRHEEAEAPPAGRASIWGTPYSGTPIYFDDLKVAP